VAEAVKRGVWSEGGFPLVVLLSACDKTTPAMLMGAASTDVPAIMVTGGPMLNGKWRQEELGSGTDLWRLWAERRAGGSPTRNCARRSRACRARPATAWSRAPHLGGFGAEVSGVVAVIGGLGARRQGDRIRTIDHV
jgi:dihydroxyacid dehydratase/phosphogluconate dehydratase